MLLLGPRSMLSSPNRRKAARDSISTIIELDSRHTFTELVGKLYGLVQLRVTDKQMSEFLF